MNLRNGQITVGEVLQNPKARAIFYSEFPQAAGLLNSPFARKYWNMPLNMAAGQARRFIPADRVQCLLNRLQSL